MRVGVAENINGFKSEMMMTIVLVAHDICVFAQFPRHKKGLNFLWSFWPSLVVWFTFDQVKKKRKPIQVTTSLHAAQSTILSDYKS